MYIKRKGVIHGNVSGPFIFLSPRRVLMVLLVFLFLHFEGPKKRLQELVPRGHAGTFTWMWRHFCFILARWWHLAGGGPFYANDEQEGVGEVPLAALPFMDLRAWRQLNSQNVPAEKQQELFFRFSPTP